MRERDSLNINRPIKRPDPMFDRTSGPTIPANALLIELLSNLLPTKGSDSVTFARTGQQAVPDHEGVYRYVADGCPGFPGARQVTNLFLYSEDFSQGDCWIKNFITRTTESVAGPVSGNVTATKLLADGTNNQHYLPQILYGIIPKGDTIAFGCLVKKGDCRYVALFVGGMAAPYGPVFDLDTGLFVEPYYTTDTSIRFWAEPKNNGWYYIYITKATTTANVGLRLYLQETSTFTLGETSTKYIYVLQSNLVDVTVQTKFAPIDYVPITTAVLTKSFATKENNQQISCWGDSLANPYVIFLQNRIVTRTINPFGVGGEISTQIKVRMLAATARLNDIVVIWAGSNNFDLPTANHFDYVLAETDIAAMTAALGANTRFIVMTACNGEYASRYSGTAAYNEMMLFNNWITSTYPNNYIDIRTYLISMNDGSVQDLIDVAHDIIPASLRVDTIHLLPVGCNLVAIQIFNFLVAKGWLSDADVFEDIAGLNGILLEPARTNFCTAYGINDVAALNAAPTNMTKSGNATATLKVLGNNAVLVAGIKGLGIMQQDYSKFYCLDNSLGGSGNAIVTIDGSSASSPQSYSAYAMVDTGTAILQNDSGEGAVNITNTTPAIIKSENVTIGGARKLQLIAPIGTKLSFCLCQAEVGSKSSSFIVTAGSAATRAATTATLPIPAKGTKVRTTETKSGVSANIDRNIADYTTTIKVGTVDTGVYAEPVQVKDLMINLLSLHWTTLVSGFTMYRRGTNVLTGLYNLDYSSDGGITWETLVVLDPSEDNVIIDSGNLYRHRIVGTSYHVDQTLTSTGYAGIEDIDWENLYST
jgi:hypothetical protein